MMKRTMILCALTALAAVANAGLTGSLSTSPEIPGLESGGLSWSIVDLEDSLIEGIRVDWDVSQNTDGSWHYQYTFSNQVGEALRMDVSHFIISISDGADIYNLSSGIEDIEIRVYTEQPSNPGFPADLSLYGVKLDLYDGQAVAEFDSSRSPMWGDIYIKGGGNPKNYAYNEDIGIMVKNLGDYTANTALDGDGNMLYKILVPDTATGPFPVPEPATLTILGFGGVLLGIGRRRI